MTSPLASICDELGIIQVSIDRASTRQPGETCAVQTLARILDAHGEEHLRSTLLTIMETENNKRMLIAPVIWAVSDLLRAHPTWFDSRWLETFDKIDLSEVHTIAKANRKAAEVRPAIATILFGALRPTFNDEKQGRLL